LRDALDLPDADREAWVRARCGDDQALSARLLRMLRAISDDVRDDAPDAEAGEIVDHMIGTRLGPFRVIGRIGKGGMGVVYRGRREEADFEQVVALKLVRRGFDFDDVRARFLRERRILARLDHPNLAHFIDGGIAPDGRPWFALEFVRGEAVTR